MGNRYAEVFGVGYVARLIGGKLDGTLYPLKRIAPANGKGTLKPESLSGVVQIAYDLNVDVMNAMREEGEELNPGEHIFTAAVYHFAGDEQWDGLTVPRLALLYEHDMQTAIRGGLIPANSFSVLYVEGTGKVSLASTMGETLMLAFPPLAQLTKEFSNEWQQAALEIKKTGTLLGIPYELEFKRIGDSAGLGTACSKTGKEDVEVVFLLLSGKNEGEEIETLIKAKELASFLPADAEVWRHLSGFARPLLVTISKDKRMLGQPAESLAWVFFRKIGVL